MPPCVCVHPAHPLAPPGCAAAHVHQLFQAPVPHGGTWRDVGWAAGRATPGSSCQAQGAQGTQSTCDTPYRPRRQSQSLFTPPDPLLCRLGSSRSVPDAIWLQQERMEALVSGSGTHSIVTWSPKPAPTSSPCPSSGTAGTRVPKCRQPAAGSPVPEAPSHPMPSCSTWPARGARGSAGEGMGIWGCSFASIHCKPWQDSSCLSCSAGFHYCPAPAIFPVCPRHSLSPAISAGRCSHTPDCLSPPARCQVPGCNSPSTDSCRSFPGQQSPSGLRSR